VNILLVDMSLGVSERIFQFYKSMRKIKEIFSYILLMAVRGSAAPYAQMTLNMIRRVDVIHSMNHWTILEVMIYWLVRLVGNIYTICIVELYSVWDMVVNMLYSNLRLHLSVFFGKN